MTVGGTKQLVMGCPRLDLPSSQQFTCRCCCCCFLFCRTHDDGSLREPQYMKDNCPVACRDKKVPFPTTRKNCQDAHEKCPDWASVGDCKSNSNVKRYCPKTCGMCVGSAAAAAAADPSCVDTNDQCDYWAVSTCDFGGKDTRAMFWTAAILTPKGMPFLLFCVRKSGNVTIIQPTCSNTVQRVVELVPR